MDTPRNGPEESKERCTIKTLSDEHATIESLVDEYLDLDELGQVLILMYVGPSGKVLEVEFMLKKSSEGVIDTGELMVFEKMLKEKLQYTFSDEFCKDVNYLIVSTTYSKEKN